MWEKNILEKILFPLDSLEVKRSKNSEIRIRRKFQNFRNVLHEISEECKNDHRKVSRPLKSAYWGGDPNRAQKSQVGRNFQLFPDQWDFSGTFEIDPRKGLTFPEEVSGGW